MSGLFEKELDASFTETSLTHLQKELPKPFEKLDTSKDTNIMANGKSVTVTIAKHTFTDLCRGTINLKRTHTTIGCPLSSALACALAKAT